MKKDKYLTVIIIMFMACMSVERVGAQSFSISNNLLYDATMTPNVGFDFQIGQKLWTVGGVVGVNTWDVDKATNKKWRHLLIAPNVKSWLGDSVFHKSYVEGDLIYSHFNVGNTSIPFGLYKGTKERRLQGDLLALGGKYGYSWFLTRHWRVAAEAGLAVGYAWYKEYECPTCGQQLGDGNRIFLLPQLGINIVFVIN